jgi:large subunit ribosomal protein L20
MGYNYSTFINALAKKKILINRLIVSELAINNPAEFNSLVEFAFAK